MRFVFKQKTADEVRISDWSSDVCSSDLRSSHEMITCTFSTTPFQFAKAMAPYIPRALPLLPEIERHAHVEEFISSSGADIYYGGSHACYVPSLDEIGRAHV